MATSTKARPEEAAGKTADETPDIRSMNIHERLHAIQTAVEPVRPTSNTGAHAGNKAAIGIDDAEHELAPLFAKYRVFSGWTNQPGKPPEQVPGERLWLIHLRCEFTNIDNPEDKFTVDWSDIGASPGAARSFAVKACYKSEFHLAEPEASEQAQADRNYSRSSDSGAGTGGGDASEGQIRMIKALLHQHGRPITVGEGMTKKDAARIIDGLKADPDFRDPRIATPNGHVPEEEPGGGEDDPGWEYDVPEEQPQGAPQTRTADRSNEMPKASPYKQASANQLATIAKLSRLLGEEAPDQELTSAEASERITVLSRKYNERKGQARST